MCPASLTHWRSSNRASAHGHDPAGWQGLVWLFALAALVSWPVMTWGAVVAGRSGARTDRILVRFAPGTPPADRRAVHARFGSVVQRRFPELNEWEVVRLAAGTTVASAVSAYRQEPTVAEVEPDYLVHLTAEPNDPGFREGHQWGLRNLGANGTVKGADISAATAWDQRHDASEIIVGIIDSGMRLTHEDLAANLWTNSREIEGNGLDDDGNGFIDDVHGLNAIANNGDVTDTAGHGTHVAGIIGAVGDNGLGVVGVAWRVRLMPLKFIGANGDGSVADAAQCIDYARVHGAAVLNASWSGPNSSSLLRTAIDKARQAGMLFVAAAGNDGANNDTVASYPANYDLANVVVVTATTQYDTLADFSNFGAKNVDLAAPGVAIYSTWNSTDKSYAWMSGTSMAAPFVAGAAAVLRAEFPNATLDQWVTRLRAATDSLPALTDRCATGGRLNLAKALGPVVVANFTASPEAGDLPLTVQFTDTTLGTIAERTWDFGDNTPSDDQARPSHVFSNEGNFTVTLTVRPPGGAPSVKRRTISVVANYRMQSVEFAWIDPSDMPALILRNNDISPAQDLPFPFTFYGQGYHQVFVGANGLAGFVNNSLTTPINSALPSTSAPNAALYPYWDDLDPGAGGSVRIGTVGTEPEREFVISWVEVPTRARPTATLSFQAILEERSHAIRFQYLEVNAARNNGAGRSATVGIENETGAVAARYAVNGTPLLANELAVRFVPGTVGGLVVTPTTPFAASGNVGGPFDPVVQSYRLRNSSEETIAWIATNSAPWLALSPAAGELEPNGEVEVVASLRAAATELRVGSYGDAMAFVNTTTGIGSTVRRATLAVNGTTGVLSVTPEGSLESGGPAGGPFSPANQVYTLVNVGDASLDWEATPSASWISVSRPGGSLAAGASTTLSVGVGSEAAELPVGRHTGTVQLVNHSNGLGTTTRTLDLAVTRRNLPLLSILSQVQPILSLRLEGTPLMSYVLEASADLRSWEIVTTNEADATGMLFFGPEIEASIGQRFLRARENSNE